MSQLDRHLSHLESSGLIAIARVLPDLEYLFRHALVKDAAYDSLLRQDRRRLHHAVGEVLEAAYSDQPQHAATLAYHFHAASEPDRARHYYWIAATTAQANYANAEAAQHFEAAFELSTSDDQRLQVMRQLGSVLTLGGRIPEGLAIYQQAIQLADRLGSLDDVAHLHAMMANGLWLNGDTPGAMKVCQEGMAKIEGTTPTPGMVSLIRQTGQMHYFTGTPQEGIPYAERAMILASDMGLTDTQSQSLIALGLLYASSDPPLSLQYYQQATEIAEAHRHYRNAALGHMNVSVRLGELFDLEGSKLHDLKALEFARQAGDGNLQMRIMNNTVETLYWLGDLKQADGLLAAEEEMFKQSLRPEWAVLSHAGYVGLVMCQRGHWESGFPIVRRWIAQTRDLGSLQYYTSASVYLAAILDQCGLYEEAEQHLLDAMPYWQQGIGLGQITPRCILIGIYAAQGRTAEAHQCLDETQAVARKLKLPLDTGDLLIAQARVMAAEGRWQEAATIYADANRWCDQHKLRPSQGHLWLLWADLMHRMGQRDQALALLSEALDLYAGMDAPGFVNLVRQRINRLLHEAPA